MLDLIIVGAGGFGREIRELVQPWLPQNDLRAKGFLASNPRDLDGYATAEPILGSPESYRPKPHERFLLAIGDPFARRRVVESLAGRGAEFITYIHPTAIVAATAIVGKGCVLYPYSIAMNGAQLGNYVLLNLYASAGHDSRLGDYANLCPYATVNGFGVVEEGAFIASHATVQPGCRVGKNSKVSANSTVRREVPPNSLVYGVPGQCVPLPTE